MSRECALEMAAGARRLFDADVAVSLTGAAGPEPHGGAEPGTVWIGLDADGVTHARGYVASGERVRVRRWAEQAALDLVRRYLEGGPLPDGDRISEAGDGGRGDRESSGPETKPQRLFVAVAIPAAGRRRRRGGDRSRGARRSRGLDGCRRRTGTSRCEFLGSTSPRLVPWVRERLAVVADRTAGVRGVRAAGSAPSLRRIERGCCGPVSTTIPERSGRWPRAVAERVGPRVPARASTVPAHLTVARSDPPLALPPRSPRPRLESDRSRSTRSC